MGKTTGAFDFDIDIGGARVVWAKEPLHARCLSDGEVDANIQLLKEDLDAVAERMKAAIREQAKMPLEFE